MTTRPDPTIPAFNCLNCKHSFISFGSTSYSDETPGAPGHWECLMKKWPDIKGEDGSQFDVITALTVGMSCPEFVHNGIR